MEVNSMSEQFQDKVEILDSANKSIVILNANTGYIETGGWGKNGSLLIYDDSNVCVLNFNAETGVMCVGFLKQGRLIVTGPQLEAEASFGGNNGFLILRDNSSNIMVNLGYNINQVLTMSDNYYRPKIKLDGNDGSLTLIGYRNNVDIKLGGNDQKLTLRDNNNKSTIQLNGKDGTLFVTHPDGKDVFRVHGDTARVYVGNNRHPGNVSVRTSRGTEKIEIDGKEGLTIKGHDGEVDVKLGGINQKLILEDDRHNQRNQLDGKEGTLFVKHSRGTDVFRVHGDTARVYVGNHRHPGNISVRNPQGGEAIELDGQNNALNLKSTNGANTIILDGNLGDIRLSGGDCAEHFNVGDEEVEPGTVLVMAQGGGLHPCHEPYDKKVAGVVSGGGGKNPGIILNHYPSDKKQVPVALNGVVFCKVDATFSAVEIGDLLTTSSHRGYAMKAAEPSKAFGTVLGKAMAPLSGSTGLIPVLVALQ